MITSFDKFLVALIMAVLYALKTWLGIDLGISEVAVGQIALAIAAVLVYIVPNKTTT